MKQDMDWAIVSTSYDPITFYCLIERTILAQTEDQYPFATMYAKNFRYFRSSRKPCRTMSGTKDLTPRWMLVKQSA
jgi:hypothetical protein